MREALEEPYGVSRCRLAAAKNRRPALHSAPIRRVLCRRAVLVRWCSVQGLPETVQLADGGHGRWSVAGRAPCAMDYSLGMSTVSITWITPFSQAMSALITLASLIFTPSVASMVTACPWTVCAASSFTTSAAVTLPATT